MAHEFLSRIADILGKDSVTLPDADAVRNILSSLKEHASDDLPGQMMQRAKESGALAQRFTTLEEFHAWLRNFLIEIHAQHAVLPARDTFSSLGIDAILNEAQCEIILAGDDPNGFRTSAEAAQVGISRAVAAFADSGAVVAVFSGKEPRTLSLLPDTHIAIIREQDIYPSMSAYAPELATILANRNTPALAVIGGPSKTADIEKILIEGVHGPRVFVPVIIGSSIPG